MQEWNLLPESQKATLDEATEALRVRIDPGKRTLAVQDFCHASQKGKEAISDFIRWLERTFRIAYGRDGLSAETRSTLLYVQLQEGLRYDLMRAPVVSGALSYAELSTAAKNEERRLAGLRKRQSYLNKPNGRRPDRPSRKPSALKEGGDQEQEAGNVQGKMPQVWTSSQRLSTKEGKESRTTP